MSEDLSIAGDEKVKLADKETSMRQLKPSVSNDLLYFVNIKCC